MKNRSLWIFSANCIVFTFLTVFDVKAQLVVNVMNQGGDVMQESIYANTSHDLVRLDFQKSEGTLITQFIDFKNGVQIFKAVVLGEEELGQSQYQTMCFITRLIKNDFITSDAMSKLRQKNPSAIRSPEEDCGTVVHNIDVRIYLDRSHYISPYISEICENAPDSTYTRDSDLALLSKAYRKDYALLLSSTRRVTYKGSSCRTVNNPSKPCVCHFELCVGWYPCGLKYCKGKNISEKSTAYTRCGIKTCRKCRIFEYPVYQRILCLWEGFDIPSS